MLEWLDAHAGSADAVSTIVRVVVTAYYAWTTRALVRETHTTLQGAARATLQERMDRSSTLCIQQPELFPLLDDEAAMGTEQDGRFHLANMFLGVLEDRLERSMSAEEWRAWVATADTVLPKPFIVRDWQRVAPTFEPGFQRFVNERIRATAA